MKSSVKGREMTREQLIDIQKEGWEKTWEGQSWAAEGCMQHLTDGLIFNIFSNMIRCDS